MTPRAKDVASAVAAVAAGQVEVDAQIVDDGRGGAVVVVGGLVYATVDGCGTVAVIAAVEDLVRIAVVEDERRDARRAS